MLGGAGCTPVVGGGSVHPESPSWEGEGPRGGLGAFSPPSGRVPPPPHRPQRVDVDEAGGVGGLVVPLHVHAAERKALSLGWGGPGGA